MYVIEHQRPYGTVVRCTHHTSPVNAWRRYKECMQALGESSAVFILYGGKEISAFDLRKDVREIK